MALLFERSARLLAADDFAACFAARQRLSGRFLILNWCPTAVPARLGLAVSRKADKRAVVRNRIKRVARTQFRLHRDELFGRDYVVTARREAASASRAALAADLLALFQRVVALPSPAAQGTMPPASAHRAAAAPVTDPAIEPSSPFASSATAGATPSDCPDR